MFLVRPGPGKAIAKSWVNKLAEVVDIDHKVVAVGRLLLAVVKSPKLQSLASQLLARVSVAFERAVASDLRGEGGADFGQMSFKWLDAEDSDLQGAGLERLLCSHVATGRTLLDEQRCFGMITDKGNVKTLNLQCSVFTTASNLAVVSCPQVGSFKHTHK